MKRSVLPFACLALAVAVSAPAHASYVDLTAPQYLGSSNFFDANVDGIRVQAWSGLGRDLGVHGSSQPPDPFSRIYEINVLFSTPDGLPTPSTLLPVNILSFTVGNADRSMTCVGEAGACPLSLYSAQGTYSLNGAVPVVFSAPDSDSESLTVLHGISVGPHEDVDLAEGRASVPTFNVDVGQVSSQVHFAGGINNSDYPRGSYSFAWDQNYTITGIEFEPVGTVHVPELTSSGTTSVLALLSGAFAIAYQRRQRHRGRRAEKRAPAVG
jgi:hypothetical protein